MFGRVCGFSLLLWGSSALAADVATISKVSLDGDEWIARGGQVLSSTCTYEQGVDFDDPDAYLGVDDALTKEGCCTMCYQKPGCAAVVFNGHQCWYKSLFAMAKSSASYNWACRLPVAPIEINANVPGDIITDLQRAAVIPDPLTDINFLTNSSLWGALDWSYSTNFSHTWSNDTSEVVYLIFEGVKMGAQVKVDGLGVGQVNDQFLRYEFDLSTILKPSPGKTTTHLVEVIFSNKINCNNRFMACTGGWDWAPYTNTFQENVPTFSRGIWRSVYTVTATTNAPLITHVKPLVEYLGPHVSAPLTEHKHAGFIVNVTTYFTSPHPVEGTLVITPEWGTAQCVSVSSPSSTSFEVTTTINATPDAIELWWPNGLGAQPLYNIDVQFVPSTALSSPLSPRRASSCPPSGSATVSTSRRVGFRVFAIVTGNDTDPSYVERVASMEGTDDLGMVLRVNGAAVYAKGANMIPMEELEGRMSDVSHVILVRSAAAAHMNMLRVWGGGIYLPDAWYDACDESGILVYHDLQYATGGPHDNGGGPQYVQTQYNEMVHQLRRLSHHPSIVIWDSCNECDGQGLYASFVMTIVAEEDKSRSIWPGCPSAGWFTGVRMLDQRPNGNRLFPQPLSTAKEHHGPYYHGSGFPAINGGINGDDKRFDPVLFDPMMPLAMPTTQPDTGVQYSNYFTSEFGSSGFSSFESMSGTLSEAHWGVHGGMAPDNCTLGFQSTCQGDNPLSQRNYPCDGLTLTFFNKINFDATGAPAFQQQLYLCMLSQALIMKQQIETIRAQNTFGTLLWQLGEVWPTGGWGTLEYGAAWGSFGQVPGGRWKILHHVLAATAYTDITVVCGSNNTCYLRNDLPTVFSGSVVVSSINIQTGEQTQIYSSKISLPAGAGSVQWFTLPSSPNATVNLLFAQVFDSQNKLVTKNTIHLLPPKSMQFTQASVQFEIAPSPNPDNTVTVTLAAVGQTPAFYVTLTTLAAGRFSDNAFMVLPNNKVSVEFIPFGTLDYNKLSDSLRLEHLGMYV